MAIDDFGIASQLERAVASRLARFEDDLPLVIEGHAFLVPIIPRHGTEKCAKLTDYCSAVYPSISISLLTPYNHR